MNDCDTALMQALNNSGSPTLWIVDENISSEIINQIKPNTELSAICNRVDLAYSLQQHGLNTSTSDFDFSSLPTVDTIIYRVSKERALVQHCIDASAKLLNVDGQLLLLGEKNDGIKTHGKFAGKIFNTEVEIKKNGLCYRICLRKEKPLLETTFTDEYSRLRIIKQQALNFYSKPGIYGWKKIDNGSRLLIETIRPLLANSDTSQQSLLDLGCGYGYLQLALAKVPFRRRFATDNNVAAIRAAEKNFAEQSLDVTVTLDDCGKAISAPVDVIVCNPPFHQGFSQAKPLIAQFVQRSLALLQQHGRAYFVVNEFIPLPGTVERCGGNWELLAHEQGFKVYAITR